MGNVIKIRKGKDIGLIGEPTSDIHQTPQPATFAIKPTDFKGLVPKLVVKEGDEVKAGEPLFFHKKDESIKFTSPVSGEVAEIVRGERRAILEIRILADAEIKYKTFEIDDPDNLSEEATKNLLLEAGFWPCLIQRPFGVLANTDVKPKAIFISGFDSAPLAADLGITLKDELPNLQTGVNALSKLTDGKVHLSLHTKKDNSAFEGLNGVERHYFEGPHPSGLVGVQIHHIDPINKGDIVWTIKPQHVALIGRFLNSGMVDLKQTIAVAGSEVSKPAYYETRLGASLDKILENNLESGNVRVISGDVLTGTAIDKIGYLGFYNNNVTVIPEGDEYEFLGWLFPSYARPTMSSTFPVSKFFKKAFKANTNLHGEHRAFVVTGQYEKVMPMDIMPVQLIKSILAQDLELMENLGIYEVIEEDLALCEFVCTSKQNVQNILADGLELMAEEG